LTGDRFLGADEAFFGDGEAFFGEAFFGGAL
jgi:hypothetical protein